MLEATANLKAVIGAPKETAKEPKDSRVPATKPRRAR
jgi:hypothetical protein